MSASLLLVNTFCFCSFGRQISSSLIDLGDVNISTRPLLDVHWTFRSDPPTLKLKNWYLFNPLLFTLLTNSHIPVYKLNCENIVFRCCPKLQIKNNVFTRTKLFLFDELQVCHSKHQHLEVAVKDCSC